MDLSWQQIEDLSKKLAAEIAESGFRPDYLIGITVGGIIPLALLAEELDISNVITVSATSYEGKERGETKVTYLPEIDLRGKKALLIDEVAETGETLKELSKILLDRYGLSELKTVTVGINRKKCKFLPDFYAIAADGWMVFPWEKE